MSYRVLGIAAITIGLVSIAAVILALVLRGGIVNSVQTIASLVAFMGVLATGLITAISTLDIRTKLNGHLAKHEEAVATAQVAATAAGSVSEQLARAQEILDKIHDDTNSNLTETKREVAELKAEVTRLGTLLNERTSRGGSQ